MVRYMSLEIREEFRASGIDLGLVSPAAAKRIDGVAE